MQQEINDQAGGIGRGARRQPTGHRFRYKDGRGRRVFGPVHDTLGAVVAAQGAVGAGPATTATRRGTGA